ncbi:glycosyltransferase [Polaribacter tangerinus]|uniref:glycosyltransferase n=1 Tax=Polaribacter tangerinus TaxID=1920034 RepID=UPI000B4B0B54|nr:glycosyltransferase [Polaribacter tangerinus]
MRILIIENGYKDLVNSRFPLGSYLEQNGNTVIYACPNPEKDSEVLSLNVSRNKTSFFLLVSSILKLIRIEKNKKVDTVVSFRFTSNLLNYFSSFFGIKKKRIGVITGLGIAFVSNTTKNKILQTIITLFYNLAKKRLIIVAQNPDDLLDLGISRGHVILGSGISGPKYQNLLAKDSQTLNLLFVGRLLKSKGIVSAVDVIKKLQLRNNKIKLIIAGYIDPNNPDSVSNDYLEEIKTSQGVEYLSYVENMNEVYSRSDILLFPSVYREGVPRTIIESLSYGLTIITKDMPGCRETVLNNGIITKNNFTEEAVNYIETLTDMKISSNKQESISLFKTKFSEKVIFPKYSKIIIDK